MEDALKFHFLAKYLFNLRNTDSISALFHIHLYLFQLFLGNTDRTTIVKHFLKRPIQARYVRINPRAWHGIHICMRFEIFGCKEGKNNVHTDFTKQYPENIYLFKVNYRNTRKSCEICSKLTI